MATTDNAPAIEAVAESQPVTLPKLATPETIDDWFEAIAEALRAADQYQMSVMARCNVGIAAALVQRVKVDFALFIAAHKETDHG